jgi:hypothetical protein
VSGRWPSSVRRRGWRARTRRSTERATPRRWSGFAPRRRGCRPGGARERAASRARADLQALFPDEFAARVQAEMAALQPDEPSVEVGRVERPVAARARLRALLCLADQHPDQTRTRFQAEAARLPLRPADHAPRRRRALAWVRALEGLRGAYPELFQARYTHELARHAGKEPRS